MSRVNITGMKQERRETNLTRGPYEPMSDNRWIKYIDLKVDYVWEGM